MTDIATRRGSNTTPTPCRRRLRTARESARDHRRAQEERELRARLTASAATDVSWESADHADRSAGLVAEVTTIDHLLRETERVLRDADPV